MKLFRPGLLSKTSLPSFFLILLGAMLAGTSPADAQTTSTNIQISSAVQQPSVKRLGINLADQDFYDSGQMLKNLIFQNPGFEAEKYRSIMVCNAVTANTCTDDNNYSPQPTGFWTGASYLVLTGNSAGKSGIVTTSTKNPTSCSGCGQIIQFDQSINAAVGDYFVMTQNFPGSGDSGWWDSTGGGGTISTETTDLSPETPGKQAIVLNAATSGQSAGVTQYFDSTAGLSFIQLNGAFAVTFRAKGVGGSNKLNINVTRMMASSNLVYLNQSVTLTNTWQDYTLTFSASETGTSVGTVQLAFSASGSSVELDDVSLAQTNSSASNPTVFRDDVVNTLQELNPGTIRMMAGGAALGSDLINQIQVPFARYREGWSTGSTSASAISYGIHEFLQLCQTVGADPWITIPTATTPAEMQAFVQYLTGTGSDQYSALRISRGQTAPWTSVFNKIHLELGNETWNGSFRGESMNYNGYPYWANTVFAAARATSGYLPAKFDLVLDGFAGSPGYNQVLLARSTQHDSIDIAPYLLYSGNDEAQATMFGALFAEPEIFDSAGGEVYQTAALASSAPTPTYLNVYETNLSPIVGNITEAELNTLTPSIGAGIGHTVHMFEMMRAGVQYQNAFALPQWAFKRSDGLSVKLWGTVVDMGTTNRRRPQFLTEAMANSAIGGNMLQTAQTGANPTWNQPLSSDNVQLSNAHYLQSFAFQNGTTMSAVVFNLSQTSALPVTFSGANAPSGSVQMTQITSANITDNNETSAVVAPASQTLSSFNASTGLSLPPFSMTVLTWSAAAAAQPPAFSVAAGSYSSTQTVALTDATSGATIYYTTDGSTPTTASSLYSTPVTVSSTETINAIAVASGLAASPVSSATYQIVTPVTATPVFSVASGTYSAAQTVSISDATAGATIYYTTNGSTPTTSSTKYSGAITVGSTETLQAVAIAPSNSLSAVASASYTVNLTVAAPVFSVAAGTYATAQTISITDSTPGVTIYYSTNGVTGTVYTGPITIASTQTLEAAAIGANSAQSAVVTATYTINPATTAPAFSVAAGTYTAAQTVSITDATAGATIYYTTNGTTPTTSSTVYSGPVTVGSTETLQAIATASNHSASTVASAAYTINLPAATPVFSVAAGTYTAAQTVSITDATAGATIYYTTNGSTPTTSSTVYSGPITVGSTETLQAIAIASNYSTSTVASAAYTINLPAATPVFSVAAGTYTVAQTVSITDATVGAKIYYTINGSTPTTSSPVYSGPITVGSTETLEAIAIAPNYSTSTVASAAYTINLPAATPVFSIAAGTYTAAQTISITDATAGATIYYTTNGSTPTTSSTVYSGPITVGSTETLQAIAIAPNYSTSAVASAAYTINLPVSVQAPISFTSGFPANSLVLNGFSSIQGSTLQLTSGGQAQESAAWYPSKMTVSSFTTDFDFQLPTSVADGFTFTLQNNSRTIWAMGSNGSGLGYQGMTKSVAVAFNLYGTNGSAAQTVGVYTNGVTPSGSSVDMTSAGINLHNGHIFHVHLAYAGTTLTVTVTDSTTKASFTKAFTVNIASSVGATTAYAGFTGSTGAYTAVQNILDWTFKN